ncbi:HPr family phosphocarrier protein [Alkaliphilus transvaalensis]|uniref:HPr family phosphocarrier protein n=1 Tax=Alkaliphilus transvaalensis TaxID=114628 RepID=UPI00047CC3A1|nr:HPr family phosphocarrier protein [Alkaliphilus transvaalensis]
MVKETVIINCEAGLHARPATLLVKEAGKYKSEITLISGTVEINAKSIMGIMALGGKKGQSIEIKVEGTDEKMALEAIVALFNSNFGE